MSSPHHQGSTLCCSAVAVLSRDTALPGFRDGSIRVLYAAHLLYLFVWCVGGGLSQLHSFCTLALLFARLLRRLPLILFFTARHQEAPSSGSTHQGMQALIDRNSVLVMSTSTCPFCMEVREENRHIYILWPTKGGATACIILVALYSVYIYTHHENTYYYCCPEYILSMSMITLGPLV